MLREESFKREVLIKDTLLALNWLKNCFDAQENEKVEDAIAVKLNKTIDVIERQYVAGDY